MTSITRRLFNLSLPASTYSRTILLLLSLWIITMISVPIAKWVWGDAIIPTAITLGLTTQFIAVTYIVVGAWGWKRTGLSFIAIVIMTWFAEFMGSSTGIPFGEYAYTDTLQPQFAHVPIVIPIAWFMMLPPSWVIAQTLTRSIENNRYIKSIIFALISALALTAWDLFLDPQMVAWGFWEWENPVGYFGIPWINYFGWILTAFIVTLIIRPAKLPTLPLLAVYGVVWFLQSFGQFFFWGQQGPAIVGFFAMGFFLVITAIQYNGTQQ